MKLFLRAIVALVVAQALIIAHLAAQPSSRAYYGVTPLRLEYLGEFRTEADFLLMFYGPRALDATPVLQYLCVFSCPQKIAARLVHVRITPEWSAAIVAGAPYTTNAPSELP
jgi:hypothetical protein